MTNWPDGMAPNQAHVHARNELTIAADPAAIWALLVNATAWPSFYPNARHVQVLDGSELAEGTRFRWTTFNIRATSTVKVFRPDHELAWEGVVLGTRAHHRWQLTQNPDGTTTVVTEETQRGPLPFLASRWVRAGLLRWHQRWLEGLQSNA
ncbi:SRPBCC family protein [Streptomyces sp. NPDC088387]|uniref:SRPBCC family protein n=1 Tax=Streptomyces sp. NPDC088387 TaxID=3365859 RepID=UPI0038112027